jgi:putative transcriptional regulator
LPIVYDKMFALLKEKGYTSYKIRQENVMGQATLTGLKNGTAGLNSKTIENLCRVLHCQPGDLMEYVPE